MKKILSVLLMLMFASVTFAQHDQYGEWQLSGQGMIYLPSSTSKSNENIVLSIESNGKGDFFLIFRWKEEPTPNPNVIGNDGEIPIVEMELSFDNAEYGYFTFRDNKVYTTHYYEFVVFDRFRGTANRIATSMIKQMANKRILKVRYKDTNGSIRTQTFNLEGLDAIIELL